LHFVFFVVYGAGQKIDSYIVWGNSNFFGAFAQIVPIILQSHLTPT